MPPSLSRGPAPLTDTAHGAGCWLVNDVGIRGGAWGGGGVGAGWLPWRDEAVVGCGEAAEAAGGKVADGGPELLEYLAFSASRLRFHLLRKKRKERKKEISH